MKSGLYYFLATAYKKAITPSYPQDYKYIRCYHCFGIALFVVDEEIPRHIHISIVEINPQHFHCITQILALESLSAIGNPSVSGYSISLER